MKFEGSGSKGTRVIERKRSVTDGQTDGRTDGQGKNNMSPPERGRHNNNSVIYDHQGQTGNILYFINMHFYSFFLFSDFLYFLSLLTFGFFYSSFITSCIFWLLGLLCQQLGVCYPYLEKVVLGTNDNEGYREWIKHVSVRVILSDPLHRSFL